MLNNIVIVDGVRTAIGKFEGSLKNFTASQLGTIVVKDLIKRTNIKQELIDELIIGCVGQVAEDAFLSRVIAINSGLPVESIAQNVNRLCGSGLQAIITAALEIQNGFVNIAIAGGVESMNNLPFYLRRARFGYRMGNNILEDGLITALSDPFSGQHMGITAENLAEKYQISREEQDKFALLSQERAFNALSRNLFKEEIVPIMVNINKSEKFIFDKDEHPRPDTTLEKLAKLKPAFKENGTVTAGNSSGINDAAAALLIMKAEKARELGFKPKVKLVDFSIAGVSPEFMGTGPIPAIKKLLKQSSITLDEIGIIELNEAFAVQAIVCIKELGLDIEKVNINGGAIAFGHPIGATGTILTIKIINEMIWGRIKYGIVSMCIGGGQGIAALLELIE